MQDKGNQMTLQHFNALNQQKQRWCILHKGVHLCQRHTSDFTVNLFALDAFYIELYCYNAGQQVFLIKSFCSTHELAPYLGSIDVALLLR